MLPGLRHHAIECRDHKDRAVDLRRAGDHVLHVVRVHRADVEMRLVADVCLLGHDWLLLVPPAALADPRALSLHRAMRHPPRRVK
jgi:hypothetical protein